jgi:tRNA (adenine22-N1)-methyltransferase
MRIGPRLKKIAAFVPPGAKIADIGTDHAYLPLWLLENGAVDFAVATDIAAGPCRAAAAAALASGAAGRIKIRQGGGLSPLRAGEADTIVIAGMGGATIAEILAGGPEILREANALVLQPMNGGRALRQWLCANGWPPAAEELAQEGRKVYEIIFAKKNPAAGQTPCGPFQLEAGPLLLKARHPLLERHVGNIAARYARVCRGMEKGRAAGGTKYQTAREILAAAEEWLKCL